VKLDTLKSLTLAVEKLKDQLAAEEGGMSTIAPPFSERERAPRYPLREDPGTIFRSKPDYDWTCPYCLKPIMEGDMVVAFQPKPGARTTYAHHFCDMLEQDYLNELDND
jgi:hypothetical protein